MDKVIYINEWYAEQMDKLIQAFQNARSQPELQLILANRISKLTARWSCYNKHAANITLGKVLNG